MLERLLESATRIRTLARMCRWRLVVLDQHSTDAEVRSIVGAWSRRTGIEAHVVEVENAPAEGFLRAGSLRQGMEWVFARHPDDIIFMLDVDMVLPANFVKLCRRYSVRGREAFFPICFSLYQNRGTLVSGSHGWWRDYGYGMSGLYVADGMKVGVYEQDRNKSSHGLEDNHAFWLLQDSGFKCNRPLVHGFFHVFHPRAAWGNSTNGIDGPPILPAVPQL